MNSIKEFDYTKILGHHFLVYGETNTGKTQFTANFVKFLLQSKKLNPKDITILEFGPKFKIINNIKIGGRIQDYYSKSLMCINIDSESEIIPPRLNANKKEELFKNICYNYQKTSNMLANFSKNPTPFLVINDISIYLHLGSKYELLSVINKSHTFLGNSYYGNSIKSRISKLLSLIEKKRIEFLIKNIEFSVFSG
jgi:hypothetical protein